MFVHLGFCANNKKKKACCGVNHGYRDSCKREIFYNIYLIRYLELGLV